MMYYFSAGRVSKLLGTTCLGCASIIFGASSIGLAQTEPSQETGCISHLEEAPEVCLHADAGTVVSMPVGVNTEPATAPQLGPYGFAISEEPRGASVTSQARPVLQYGGGVVPEPPERGADRLLAMSGVQVTSNGLTIQPRLAVSTNDMRSSYTGGTNVGFRASSNYPAWVSRAEIRIADARDPRHVVAVVPVQPNGEATWALPTDGHNELTYSLRVYDAQGRYDETKSLPLNRAEAGEIEVHPFDGPIVAPGEGVDMTARRRIPVRGGAVTVSGHGAPGRQVMVMGEAVPVDGAGRFVSQRILPVGEHSVSVSANGQHITRDVTVPANDMFYVGLADLTFGDGYTRGRLAGYGKVRTASGYVFTGAVDTHENEIEDIFDNILDKSPRRVVGRLDDDDVYPTFGDDSTIFDDAPTSGKIYARVEHGNSYIMWGDFKTAEENSRLVGQSRTLYGLSGSYESADQTAHGEPRLRFSAYASNPDRLLQRDVLRGTGGTFYSLKRQDILPDTETIYIVRRDRITGQIIDRQMLQRDVDYRVNYYQGTVILNTPLSSGTAAAGVVGGPLSDTTIDLVSEYEYVPTVGDVDGSSVGFRGEVWATDELRLGLSGQTETTGVADNEIIGADILWRHSDKSYVSLDYARSEGPGFGRDLSLTGGLDLIEDSGTISAGRNGLRADAWRIEARADLGELSGGKLQGDVLAYADGKEEGFVGDGYDIDETQNSYGVEAVIATTASSNLKFSHKHLDERDTGTRTDTELAFATRISERLDAEFAIGRTDRDAHGSSGTADVGERTDAALRLGYRWSESTRAWVYAQTTLEVSGQLEDNDRYGVGGEARLTDRISVSGEVSDGDLGTAGRAELTYDDNAGNRYYASYGREFEGDLGDPWSRLSSDSLRNEFVIGAERKLSDEFRVYSERKFGETRRSTSLATDYGVEYTPSDQWRMDALLSMGTVEYEEDAGRTIDRKGLSVGLAYSDEDLRAGWRGEYRLDEDSEGSQDRRNWATSAYLRYTVSDDWRLLANLDATISEADNSDLRDGKYVEANLGFAYRPVENDRWNALFRYTYLYDLPGPDQVNIDGDILGPKQRSHILSADTTYDINEQLTIGGKYGLRFAEVADRGSNEFRGLTTHLGILRADYHVVHNWDLLAEGRVMVTEETDIIEKSALLGAYRHFGNNLKAGIGYQWGDVSDDLRSLESNDGGMFFNIIGKF